MGSYISFYYENEIGEKRKEVVFAIWLDFNLKSKYNEENETESSVKEREGER